MFENYLASKEDIQTLIESLQYVFDGKLQHIFADKSKLESYCILSFDSKYIYLLPSIDLNLELETESGDYKIYKIPHEVEITNQDQQGWMANLRKDEFTDYLPKDILELDLISGGLLTPLTKIQSSFEWYSPYTTKESYLATILHEFAHIYFNNHREVWYSNNSQTLPYLKAARGLFSGEELTSKFQVRVPTYPFITELFAYCTEYTAAEMFWSEHFEGMKKQAIDNINRFIKQEDKKDLRYQNSILYEDYHIYATTIGRILIEQHPNDWVEILLTPKYLF